MNNKLIINEKKKVFSIISFTDSRAFGLEELTSQRLKVPSPQSHVCRFLFLLENGKKK